MMSSRSKSATTSSASCSGDPGFSASPASTPSRRAAASSRCTWTVASGWKVKTDAPAATRSEEHTSELQSQSNLVCRLLLEKKKTNELQTHPNRACFLRLEKKESNHVSVMHKAIQSDDTA